LSKQEVKRSSEKQFKGSRSSSFYNEDYFLKAKGSNYGRRDKSGNMIFLPYEEQYYLPRNQQLAQRLIQRFHPKTVLVLGCARGYMVKAFRNFKVDAVGVDISEWAIQNTPEDVADYCFCGDICDLSKWKDKQFDLVVAFDVLEHIKVPDLYVAIKEAARIGKNIVLDVPIRQDDSHPDQSKGTDKSHVSVYTKEWWIRQFVKHGFDAATFNVYTYPEGDQGATITFRPKQEAAEKRTVTLAPNSHKFKILWLSNSPYAPSGYGVQTDLNTRELMKYYSVHVLANWGLEGRKLGLNNLVVYPKLPGDAFGRETAMLYIAGWQPDVFVTLYDIWMGAFTEPRGGTLQPIHPRWIPIVPVDHDPVPEQTVVQASAAYKAVAMSKFGYNQLRQSGVEAVYIPHCIDTNELKPVATKKLRKRQKQWLEEHSDPLNLQIMPKPEIRPDDFVIGINAANKDPYDRKSWGRHFTALQLFLENNKTPSVGS